MFSGNGPFAWFKWEALFTDWRLFASGFGYTILLSVCALLLALFIGIIVGICSTSQSKILRGIMRVYVEFFQNTPLLVQIFVLYNGLPFLGVVLSVTTIGVVGVGVYHGAYIAEVVRSGIGSISKGQLEAAYSQGFTYWQAMAYIIIPQARRVIMPPLTMQAVNLIKNTSMIAIISGADIIFTAKSWSSTNMYYGPAFVLAGLLYFILCFPLTRAAKKMELKAQEHAPGMIREHAA
ncbi:MAG: amino acid ABC transporter permease [Clostridiales bacterium]|nr:amino acid ABC transporter permease [Clostridiales bacterium]